MSGLKVGEFLSAPSVRRMSSMEAFDDGASSVAGGTDVGSRISFAGSRISLASNMTIEESSPSPSVVSSAGSALSVADRVSVLSESLRDVDHQRRRSHEAELDRLTRSLEPPGARLERIESCRCSTEEDPLPVRLEGSFVAAASPADLSASPSSSPTGAAIERLPALAAALSMDGAPEERGRAPPGGGSSSAAASSRRPGPNKLPDWLTTRKGKQ